MHYLIGHLLRINHFFHPNSCLSSCGNEEGEGGKKPLSFPDLSSKLPIYAQNITNTAELFEPGINLENLLLLWVSRDLAYLYLLKEPCHWKQSQDYFKWMNNEIAQLSNGFQISRLAQDTLLGEFISEVLGLRKKHAQAPTGASAWGNHSQRGKPTVTRGYWKLLWKTERRYFIFQTVSLREHTQNNQLPKAAIFK